MESVGELQRVSSPRVRHLSCTCPSQRAFCSVVSFLIPWTMFCFYYNEMYLRYCFLFLFSVSVMFHFFCPSGPEVESRIWWIFHSAPQFGWFSVVVEMHKLFWGKRRLVPVKSSHQLVRVGFFSIRLCVCVVSLVLQVWFASVFNVLWKAVVLDLSFLSRIKRFFRGRILLLLLAILSSLQWFKSYWRCLTSASHVLFPVQLHS